ncbi:DoxX family protein [Actinacidiphila soli]|jgi:putative oxidoreductase|uniref:DoxX family protein n=1 Tax=Actinacidiphila soli TaxID=2487275 RepID=UPI000FCA0C8A|nr:DoxX family membrane protein [Actinacidiphila soli]
MAQFNRKDLGLLALRLGLGSVLFAHGAQKLFGWFGGLGLDGTASAMEHMGFVPSKPSALAAGLGEAGGGALLALGLATPAAGAAAAGAMAGAVSVHAPAGFFAMSGGFELPAFLGYSAAGIGIAGPGRYSLDHLTGHCLDRPWVGAVAFSASALAAAAVLTHRAKILREREQQAPDSGSGAAQP